MYTNNLLLFPHLLSWFGTTPFLSLHKLVTALAQQDSRNAEVIRQAKQGLDRLGAAGFALHPQDVLEAVEAQQLGILGITQMIRGITALTAPGGSLTYRWGGIARAQELRVAAGGASSPP